MGVGAHYHTGGEAWWLIFPDSTKGIEGGISCCVGVGTLDLT